MLGINMLIALAILLVFVHPSRRAAEAAS
jgi:hypothetical protein